VEIHFLPPVPVNKEGSFTALKEKVFTVMKDYYVSKAD
jgi:hypothetical protein